MSEEAVEAQRGEEIQKDAQLSVTRQRRVYFTGHMSPEGWVLGPQTSKNKALGNIKQKRRHLTEVPRYNADLHIEKQMSKTSGMGKQSVSFYSGKVLHCSCKDGKKHTVKKALSQLSLG